MKIKELRQIINMSQRQFSSHFGIPLGTLRNWEQGIATPPEYVLTMILATVRRDKMINVETIKFLNMLNKLAELSKGGIDDFTNATQANIHTKVFYDAKNANDGRFPIVLDACLVDDPECYHHDIICYYDSESQEFTVTVVFNEDEEEPLIRVDLTRSKEQIAIENGRWYFT